MKIAKIHGKITHHQIRERSHKNITIKGKQYVPIWLHLNKYRIRSSCLQSEVDTHFSTRIGYGSIKYHEGENANSKPEGSFYETKRVVTKASNETHSFELFMSKN